jgi:AcrR family transcriptional regulator
MPKIDVHPRKNPRQPRSQQMVQAIVDAAARVLARHSLQGFNTNQVAEVAGVSVGSLYQYFPNKAALIAALIARAQTELADAVERTVVACEGMPLEAAMAALVRVAIDQQYGKPLLAAALDHEERRLPLQCVLSEAEGRLVGSMMALLQRHRSELHVAALRVAARDCLVIAKALVEADSVSATRAPADLQQRVERALLGYLRYGD